MTLEDRLAVQDVIVLYAQLLDSRQFGRVASEVFARDAVLETGGEPIVGRAAIDGFFTSASGMLGTSHNVSNFIVEADGDGARSQCHCVAWHWLMQSETDTAATLRPAEIVAVGGYEDVLRREDGRWKITHRRMVSYGTGIGVGAVPEPLQPLFRSMAGRGPTWP